MYHLTSTLRPSLPATSIFRHVVLSTSSTFYNVGLLEESLSSSMLYLLRTQLPPLGNIVSIPTASFVPWALPKRISPLAPLLMKLLCPDDSRIGTLTPIHRQNHLQLLPLRLHRHQLLHPHLPVRALAHHHPIPYSYYMIPPHPPPPHGRHPLADLLLPLFLRRWIVLINVLLMAKVFYMDIFGRRLDTGLLPQHRLRLLLMTSPHHLLQDLLRKLYAAVLARLFDSGALAKNSALSVTPYFPPLFFRFSFSHLTYSTSWCINYDF